MQDSSGRVRIRVGTEAVRDVLLPAAAAESGVG